MTKSDYIEQNKQFYNKFAQEFSTSRQYFWKGWGRVGEILIKEFSLYKKVNYLDLGCGNGRFYNFLCKIVENNDVKWDFEYLGIDNSKKLLNIARKKYKNAEFYETNAFEPSSVKDNFDVITAFGLTHHIPVQKKRNEFFTEYTKKLKPNGLFIFSNWNYFRDKRFSPVETLGENDFLLSWDKKKKPLRFYHKYTNEEIQKIVEQLSTFGAKLIEEYESDGKSGDLNSYYIFKLPG